MAQASAADFSPGPGTYTANTTTLTLTGPGTNVTGVDHHGVAVFSFHNVKISPGVTIDVVGKRPFELKAARTLRLGGLIDGSGTDAVQQTPGPYAGGPGGAAGGAQFSKPGHGPGGGGSPSNASSLFNGGGGGGFGGAGAVGGVDTADGGGTAGASGKAYGNLNKALRGGSGGGGASNVGGGGGGGAIELSAPTLRITASGDVLANGGSGSGGGDGGSGGGSGGGILLHANTVNVAGTIEANGGGGAGGGCCGDGGGSGGGRIAYQFGTLINPGTASVKGGLSGVSGVFGHGFKSPKPHGDRGVITKEKLP
jgi:hypothetical protein